MQNLLLTLFTQYSVVSNNANLVDKIKIIKEKFSLNEENIQLFFIGILYDFIKTQPQYYFNRDVENEVFENLDNLFLQDRKKGVGAKLLTFCHFSLLILVRKC